MGKRRSFGHEEEEEDVKFAKRRNTLYKKAQELSILCGSDIAVVVISRATGKVSTYGSPDPRTVIGRYRSQKKHVQDCARSRSGSGKVIMTKDEENTMKHLLVPYEKENPGTIPNPEPVSTEPFLLPGLMEIASSPSSWMMPASSSIQSSQPLATSYGCGCGLDGLSYFDFDASSPKSLNEEESGATYGSAPMIYSSSSFSSSGSGFGFLSSSSDYGCGFNGLSAPDSLGCGLDPNFLNQERGAQYDGHGSSIPISYSSSSSTVSSVLPPSSSIDCLQPMATPPTGYGFDDTFSLDVTELEPSFDVGDFLDELNRSHPISPSSNIGHGFNDDDPLLFDVNDDDPLFFDMIDDDPFFFDVNEFLK